jgi:tRNA pseudouridine55 synthase
MNGFLVVDKPAGMTSHDVVAIARRILKQKKAGHTGTLDPFATGVLPLALGEATKAIPFLDEAIKQYRAVMCLGISTDTQDGTGKIVRRGDCGGLSKEILLEAISRFKGASYQIPPMYSAVKKGGTPLYKLARRGEEVERAAREIIVHELIIEYVDLPLVTFTVSCSRGTYVRTLASDLGDALGCGAHLRELCRLRSGPFSLANAVSPDTLRTKQEDGGGIDDILISPYHALSHLRDLELTARGAEKVRHGVSPAKDDIFEFPSEEMIPGQKVRLSSECRLLAVAEYDPVADSSKMKTVCLLRVFT